MKANNYTNFTDEDLLLQYETTRNNALLGVLLQRYTLLLLGVCLKYLKNEHQAKDAVQQIFLKALNEIPKYKINYFKSWIYMVAKNHCLMQLRNKNLVTEINDNIELQSEQFDIDIYQKKEEDFQHLQWAINQLNTEQKQCVQLFYLQKMSYNQIVETTQYSLLQVKSYIQNGKRNLKLLIEKKRQTYNGK